LESSGRSDASVHALEREEEHGQDESNFGNATSNGDGDDSRARRKTLKPRLKQTHAKQNPTTLFDIEIKPSEAAQTIPSTVSGYLANKTAALASGNKTALASMITNKLRPPAPSPTAAPSCLAPSDSNYTSQFNTSSQVIIECSGVPLKSISNFAMGECGTRTTADPR